MAVLTDAKERWVGSVSTVVIGADAKAGGTRTSVVAIGGETALPFIHFEGETPNRAAVAMEVWDIEPVDWPAPLLEALGSATKSPAEWARKCVEEFGVDLVCLKLMGTHPDFGDASPQSAARVVESVLRATGVPLIIWGSEHDAKDNLVLPACSQAAKGEKCVLGVAKVENYKTLVAACSADGHSLIGLSPIDINIAKQLNILISEMGFPLDRVVMYQTTGALGYGLEYTYSIQERARLAALGGDKMMAAPVICMVGQEAWRAKEAKATAEEQPSWGDERTRGVYWEYATAASLLQAGSDIMVMRHPRAALAVKKLIGELMG